MSVIDVHTHMLTLDWIELLKQHGGVYDVKPTRAGQNSIWKDGAPFMTLFPGMWDYDLRIKAMDQAKVDLAIISLTCPNCFFGDRAVSLQAATEQIVRNCGHDRRPSRASPSRRHQRAGLADAASQPQRLGRRHPRTPARPPL